MKIVIGSRGSQLALWQAKHIEAKLQELGAETHIEIIKTSGDKIQDVPLAQMGGKGLFTKEIEEALLAKTIDVAVHSLKDVPSVVPDGLTLAAIPEREDPRDALIGHPLSELGDGARVGTSSLRRSAQLRALGQGIKIEMLRGNVDTRLRKLDEGHYDAIVLAAAGLRRLGLASRITALLPPDVMCPAVGQGALGIETRAEGEAFELVQKLEHRETRLAVTAERTMLKMLEGGCQVPIGAFATIYSDTVTMRGIVLTVDGCRKIEARVSGKDAESVGRQVAQTLLDQGAGEILRAL